MSKTRLAAVKQKLTIPKLELVAVALGARLAQFVAEKLAVPVDSQVLWTDSQCVLCWLKAKQGPQRFVQRRVDEILSNTSLQFRYVPSENNPADIPTKGARSLALSNNSLWWKGPGWLRKSPDNWPGLCSQRLEDADGQVDGVESPPISVIGLNIGDIDISSEVIDETRHGSLPKLLRVTSYVFRFVNNARKGRRAASSIITQSELSSALGYWVRLIQRKHFPQLIHLRDLSKQNIFAQLRLFRDPSDIIRCQGRIDHAAVGYEAVHPALLPNQCHFTDLVVLSSHREALHAGVAQTLAHVRQQFWIVQGRASVKRTLRGCRTCRRFEGRPLSTPSAPPLPLCRIEESPPFTCTGVDYMGPLGVLVDGEVSQKAWICLFTCAVVRAVHLEVVQDMSTEQFLLALRRFVAIYGCPSLMVSDNGRQFHMAAGFIRRKLSTFAESEKFQQFAGNNGLEWRFIVEMAPWMGGMYERLVGTVKRSLRKCLGLSRVTLAELQTVVAEITAVVNSRPITYVEDDVASMSITPMQLLSPMRGKAALPLVKTLDDPPQKSATSADNLVNRWKNLQGAVSNFWRGWRTQYLLSLRERQVRHPNRGTSGWTPKVGMVVHLKENLPRSVWRLGRIETLHRSDDGQIRSVTVRTPNKKQLRRPLRLVFPLELDVDEADDTTHEDSGKKTEEEMSRRPSRKAAVVARRK